MPYLGEFRMVFGLLDEQGEPTPFTVIFEYKVLSSSCNQVLENARAFHTLGSMEFGPEFNAALQVLTDKIVPPGIAANRVNGSNLLALRTNEAFLGTPHEFRSFVLAIPEDDEEDEVVSLTKATRKPNGRLVHHFQAETPALRYQGTQTLVDFINEFTPPILSQVFRAPSTYRGEPFLAGVAHLDSHSVGAVHRSRSAPRPHGSHAVSSRSIPARAAMAGTPGPTPCM